MRGKVITENAYALIISIINQVDRKTALKECGIEAPYEHKLRDNYTPTKIPESDKEVIYNYYYKCNMSMSDIGEIYGVAISTVKHYMLKMCIPLKRPGRYVRK